MVSLLSLLRLSRIRRALHTTSGRLVFGSILVGYLFAAMQLGQMLILGPTGAGSTSALILPSGVPWWNYPGLLVIAPNAVLALPFFPTIVMTLVGLGVALAATSAIVALLPALRARARRANRRATAGGVLAGATPAFIGLGLLGACCCTGCVGAAGVAVVAGVSGTSVNQILLNDWFVGVFQVVFVGLALVVQERSLALAEVYCPVPPPLDRRFAAGTLLRLGLIVAGITWSLAMFVEWGDNPPLAASAATWYHWIFEHQLLAGLALTAGLLPQELAQAIRRLVHRFGFRLVRGALLVGGLTWGVGLPPPFTGLGLGGFVNELLGYLGAPAAWGAIPPDSPLGAALAFHWALQHTLLAAFAVSVAVVPLRAIVPLEWTVGTGVPEEPTEERSVPTGSPPGPVVTAEGVGSEAL